MILSLHMASETSKDSSLVLCVTQTYNVEKLPMRTGGIQSNNFLGKGLEANYERSFIA